MTIVKMTTLHLHRAAGSADNPNRLVTTGSRTWAVITPPPDNLYMLGLFDPRARTNPVTGIPTPPETRYWSVTLESIGKGRLEPLVRQSSTNKGVARPDGFWVRTIGAEDRGRVWLDTGGRRRVSTSRGWWLDKLAPDVAVRLDKETQR